MGDRGPSVSSTGWISLHCCCQDLRGSKERKESNEGRNGGKRGKRGKEKIREERKEKRRNQE